MLPVSRPSIGNDELIEIGKILDSGWLGLGSTVFEFEKKLEEYLDSPHVLTVNTGTSALHLALDAFGVGPGDEVIVPSLTFCASIQAITVLGAIPVFCEINAENLNLDVQDVKKRVTKKTKAIMPIHYCGQPCDMNGLISVARENNLFVIEDAAHAFGSTYRGKKIGTLGDATCFSFDPIKTLTCGEGGAISLADAEVAEIITKKRILGIDKDTWHRHRNERSWDYAVTTQGYRYHMSNINAAIGMVQLSKVDIFIRRKKDIVNRYNTAFSNLPGMKILTWNINETAPFAYIVRVPSKLRDNISEFLKVKGVGTGIHYIPNHIQPFFEKYKSELPITEQLGKEILTLPLYFDMTDDEVSLVIESMLEYFSQSIIIQELP